MTMKAVRDRNGTIIPLYCIERVYMIPEEVTGDGEGDRINGWRLMVQVSSLNGSNGSIYTIFEAGGFDNTNETFCRNSPIVEGKNYRLTRRKRTKLEQAVKDETDLCDIIKL